jgi:putative transposase
MEIYMRTMRVNKAVIQNIPYNSDLDPLLEHFRKMVNYCIHIGLEKNLTSRYKIQNEVWYELKTNYSSRYTLTAVEKAVAILKNYRKAKRKNPNVKKPYVRKLFISIPYLKIISKSLRVPIYPNEWITISLNRHTLEVLSDPSLRLGSALLTRTKLSISYSKEVREIQPSGYMGIDRNLNNVTTVSSDGSVKVYDLSECTRIKSVYREVKSHFKRNDVRIRKKIFSKYGLKQRNKVNQILHNTSKKIMDEAKSKQYGIVMEKLTGIRKLYCKGNGQGRNYRARMNSWSYFELQRQIEYKEQWNSLPVIYVHPQRTSSTCAICGSKIIECTERQVYCPTCKTSVDRDVNASRNILARGVGSRQSGLGKEAVKGNQIEPAILKVDPSQLSLLKT